MFLGESTMHYTKMDVTNNAFQEMKFNKMLHDNWIEYFMVWTQICMVICICSEIHRTFLQLELVA
jgi:hypothetical protein